MSKAQNSGRFVKVRGIGKVKQAQYGKDILKIVRDNEKSARGEGKHVQPLKGLNLVKRIAIM
jgi:hypothetical protein